MGHWRVMYFSLQIDFHGPIQWHHAKSQDPRGGVEGDDNSLPSVMNFGCNTHFKHLSAFFSSKWYTNRCDFNKSLKLNQIFFGGGKGCRILKYPALRGAQQHNTMTALNPFARTALNRLHQNVFKRKAKGKITIWPGSFSLSSTEQHSISLFIILCWPHCFHLRYLLTLQSALFGGGTVSFLFGTKRQTLTISFLR